MKKLLIAVMVAVAVSLTLPSCAFLQKPTTQRVAVNTLFSTHKAVDLVLDGYLDLIVKGQLVTNSLPKVAAKYDNFQAAFRLAVVVVAGDTNAVAPPTVTDAARAFTDTVTLAKKGGL